MSYYSTGTITVTNGNAVVTGSGTAWAVAAITGGMFTQVGVAVPILSVDSDTQITLVYAWPGVTAAGAAYAIDRENSDAANIVDLYDKLSRILVTLSLAGITPESSGTLTDRAALSLAMADKGYLFLHAEVGVAFAFYRWNGTSWDGPFAVANAVATGGVSSLVSGTGVTVDNTNPAIPVVSATPHAATSKATPVDADEMSLFDSAASFGLKKLTWANLKAGILAYFNGTAKASPVAADRVWLGNSAASNVPVYSTWTQILAAIFGTSAVKNTGTSGNTVPLLDGVNTWSGVQTLSAVPVLSGGAVAFPSTQVPSANANALDDYERGTWTMGVTFGGAAVGITYTAQAGTYVKIGRLVFVRGTLVLSNKGSSAGTMNITGLPFAVGGALNCSLVVSYWAPTTSVVGNLILFCGAGGTDMQVFQGGATSAAQVTNTQIANTTQIQFSGCYEAAT